MKFNFTVIRKNQLLAVAITLMLVTAGYLNYKYDPTRNYDVEVTSLMNENLGDAVLVDANGDKLDYADSENYTVTKDKTTPVFNNQTVLENSSGNTKENEELSKKGFVEQTENPNQTQNVPNNDSSKETQESKINNENEKVFKKIEDYFISTRIDRTNHYAEEIETYERILLSETTSTEQKNKAQEAIDMLNQTRNSIMIAENLIKLKGFEEAVILVNENSINVVIASEGLEASEVAQIQSIIMNEFSTKAENVHIIQYN